MHILSLVIDNNPSWMIQREENDRRNYFMINLHESMGLGRDRTRDPWICSQTRICCQTRYRLCYAPGFSHCDGSSRYMYTQHMFWLCLQVMQFGRIDSNAYTLDFQYPFTAIQAFAVALANVTQRLKWSQVLPTAFQLIDIWCIIILQLALCQPAANFVVCW